MYHNIPYCNALLYMNAVHPVLITTEVTVPELFLSTESTHMYMSMDQCNSDLCKLGLNVLWLPLTSANKTVISCAK